MPSEISIVNVTFKSGQEVTVPVTQLHASQTEDRSKYVKITWTNIPKQRLKELRKQYPELKLGQLESLNVAQVEAITVLDTVDYY